MINLNKWFYFYLAFLKNLCGVFAKKAIEIDNLKLLF